LLPPQKFLVLLLLSVNNVVTLGGEAFFCLVQGAVEQAIAAFSQVLIYQWFELEQLGTKKPRGVAGLSES